jgi:hypothetical protein
VQLGGAPAALMATLVEQFRGVVSMPVVRLTIDLLRPVPLAPLIPEIVVVRAGKRIQVLNVTLSAGGIVVAMCTALRMRRGSLPVDGLPDGRQSTAPGRPVSTRFPLRADRSHGARFAIEFLDEEPGTWLRNPTWVRQRVDVVEDEETAALARLAFAADFASGVGHPWHLPVYGVNADITLNVIRLPESEWLCLDGRAWITAAGIGQVQATIADTSGILAAVSIARLVDAEAEAQPK